MFYISQNNSQLFDCLLSFISQIAQFSIHALDSTHSRSFDCCFCTICISSMHCAFKCSFCSFHSCTALDLSVTSLGVLFVYPSPIRRLNEWFHIQARDALLSHPCIIVVVFQWYCPCFIIMLVFSVDIYLLNCSGGDGNAFSWAVGRWYSWVTALPFECVSATSAVLPKCPFSVVYPGAVLDFVQYVGLKGHCVNVVSVLCWFLI